MLANETRRFNQKLFRDVLKMLNQTRQVQCDGRHELRHGGADCLPPGEAPQGPDTWSPHREAGVGHRPRRHAVLRRRRPGDRLLPDHRRSVRSIPNLYVLLIINC